MKKTMEWSDPVIIKLSENRGASGAAACSDGGTYGSDSCINGAGATSECATGLVVGSSGTVCFPTGGSAS